LASKPDRHTDGRVYTYENGNNVDDVAYLYSVSIRKNTLCSAPVDYSQWSTD